MVWTVAHLHHDYIAEWSPALLSLHTCTSLVVNLLKPSVNSTAMSLVVNLLKPSVNSTAVLVSYMG